MSDLLALADRCEREEPNWSLDCAISLAITGAELPSRLYTTSLDAAMTLVPFDTLLWFTLQRAEDGDWLPELYLKDKEDPRDAITVADGIKTAALAVCAAALRAHAVLANR